MGALTRQDSAYFHGSTSYEFCHYSTTHVRGDSNLQTVCYNVVQAGRGFVRRLKITLFGPPHIEIDGQRIDVERRKAVALLAYLAVTAQAHSREALATLLWPDHDSARALTYLRRTLWELNSSLGDGWLVTEQDRVALATSSQTWLDVAEFQQALAVCITHGHAPQAVCPACQAPLEAAVTLAGGDFMAGFNVRDSADFEEWQFFQAEQHRQALASALARLVTCYQAAGQSAAALPHARRWLSLDPLHEPAHRALMTLYAATDQRSAALRQYQECVRILDAELGTVPQPETTALAESIRTGDRAHSLTPLPITEPSHPTLQSNLPAPTTPFVGRRAELETVAALLHDPACRLLTILGPGGTGKTRLALQVAIEQGHTFADGTYFVPLASLSAGDFLVPAIADAVRFSFAERADAVRRVMETQHEQLMGFLRDKFILLVMDNFEHLAASASLLTDILERAAGVKIVVTSRTRLNLHSEWVYELEGMRYPRDDVFAGNGRLVEFSAVKLFIQHAERTLGGRKLPAADIPCAARICQLVDGMPLGIELAAAWVRMLPCAEIAREIEQNLDFLETTLRDVPARHHSLRAVFEHSWNLLTPAEQAAFPKLAVFQGGFTRAAAAEIAGVRLPLLTTLADKSLLHVADDGRYTLHEVLRQYALERLAANRTAEIELRAQHSRITLAFVESREDSLHGSDQLAAMSEIEREIENIRAAWVWAADHQDVTHIQRSLHGLVTFYGMRNWPEEADDILGRAAAALVTAPDRDAQHVRAMLVAMQASFAGARGAFDRASDLIVQCIELARSSDARLALAWGKLLAITYLVIEDITEVRQTYAEFASVISELDRRANVVMAYLLYARRLFWQEGRALETRDVLLPAFDISRELGDRWLQADCLLQLGVVAYSLGEYAEAQRLHSETLRIRRDLGDIRGIARALVHLGEATMRLGRYAEAQDQFSEALASARITGDRQYAAVCLDCLGYISFLEGAYAIAQQQFEEGLRLRQAADDPWGIPWTLFNLGNVALVRGELDTARQHYRDARRRFQDTNSPWGALMALKKLGEVELAVGGDQLAEETLRTALHEAVEQTRISEVVEILVILADLCQQQNRASEAMTLLTVAQQHAAITPDVRARAADLAQRVAATLPPDQMAAIEARAHGVTLEDLVNAYG